MSASMLRIRVVSFAFLMIFTLFSPSYADSTFLWHVKTEQNTVYFLGSIHILNPDQYPLADPMERAFKDAEIVVFETNLDSMNTPNVQALMLQKSMYGSDRNLQSTLSKETYTLVKKRVESYNLPMAQFNLFRPWFLAMTFTVLEAQKMGLVAEYGIDSYFFNKAKQEKKRIDALETVEFQLSLFTNMSAADQELFLKYTLADLDMISTELPQMIHAWQTGNVTQMEQLVSQSVDEYPEIRPVYERLDDERNQNWLPQIEGYLKSDQDVLVIVGALHLTGKNSVIDLLQQKGYKIEQL